MKHLLILLFVASALFAQCPLGYSPEEACTSDSPSCGLFTDGDGDSFCDNPGPQAQSEPDVPDEIIESDPVPVAEEDSGEPVSEEDAVTDQSCPLGLTPQEACNRENSRCVLYTDSNGDNFCDNPGPQPVVIIEEVEDHQSELPIEEETATEEISVEEEVLEEEAIADEIIPVEPVSTDSLQQRNSCPLGYTQSEACSEDSPDCAFFDDTDLDTFCNNPGPGRENGTVCSASDSSTGLQTSSIIGCPLGLPPEAACPDSLALCPHWYGLTSNIACSNPAGGSRRIRIVLITLGVLLPLSTWLSRRFYGRRLKDRLKRTTAHHVIRGASLMILGFGVQGCFCPLGTFQYAFTAEGLAFLGLSGVLIFLLPLVFSAFFGRVFCGWVCPMGAVQEFLYSIHVPGRRSPSGKFHYKLRHLSKILLFLLIAVILLNRFDIISIKWTAPFCVIDPFHTIFTLFLSGSLIVAGITIVLSIFVRRFFCRYFCFYGAALSILARLALWNKIKGTRSEVPVIDSDEEFDK